MDGNLQSLETLYENMLQEADYEDSYDEAEEDYAEDDSDLIEMMLAEDAEDDFPLEALDFLDTESYAEGTKREKANKARSLKNARNIKSNRRYISKVEKRTRRLEKYNKINQRRWKKYKRDEYLERRRFRAIAKQVKDLDKKIDEQQSEWMLQLAIQGAATIFANRTQELRMRGVNTTANPEDTYTVLDQKNDLIGTVLPIAAPYVVHKLGIGKSGGVLGGGASSSLWLPAILAALVIFSQRGIESIG